MDTIKDAGGELHRPDMENLARERVLNVVLLGCGGVGKQLLQRILTTRALHSSMGLHVAVVAVSDSQGIVFNESELDDSALKQIISAKDQNTSLSGWISSVGGANYSYKSAADNEQTFRTFQTPSVPTVVVDCTASETGESLGRLASLGFCVVLANKKPITAALDVYDQIVSAGRRFRCESTVGAGLPVMATLSRTLAAGDPIRRIVGALSGTLGYVMSGVQDDLPYSEVVTVAKSRGFTEPDPRDDLSGMDVARKALIMARAIGWRINMQDVEVESLYPAALAPNKMSSDEFLAKGLLTLNSWMREKIEAARSKGSVVRYVATVENHRCKVGLREVRPDSPSGRLRGSDNLIEMYTDCYEASPLVIQGAGAGNDTTAAGVLADIIDLQDLCRV